MKSIFIIFLLFYSNISFSQSSAFPQVSYTGGSGVISNYLRSQFQNDYTNALLFAGMMLGENTGLNDLKIDIKDSNQANGQAFVVERRIVIVVNQNLPDISKIESFKASFFHEVGHHVISLYLRNASVIYKNFLESSKKMKDPAFRSDSAKFVEVSTLAFNLKKIVTPYEELIADVFRVFFLQNPGGPLVSRDFSNLETNDPSRFAKDEHTIFNPVRRALWEQFIQKNINNKAQLVILYRALAKSIAEEIDLQKNLIGQKQVIDVLALNAQLLNRIKFNLAR